MLVDEDQAPLAIGSKGINVNLASKLTGYDIDIVQTTKKLKNLRKKKLLKKKLKKKKRNQTEYFSTNMAETKYRPPIVTILGHVDHGKTTLLDYIRKSSLTEKEFGGITQRIGAYEINTGIKGYNTDKITFIDTPGHEAFSLLRARGAQAADIAILIIDAKDSVMPQTVESISHIQAANISFIIALNKIDLPDANPEKVKNDLMKYNVLVEGKGGGVPVVNISAKTGKGIHELLEAILLLASDLNLHYSESDEPKAIIIETKKNKRGVVVSAIIKDGKIKIADLISSEDKTAKVRSMTDDLGKSINEVVPSKPFELFGFETMPKVGSLIVLQSEFSKVKKSTQTVQTLNKPVKKFDLESILKTEEKTNKLSLIIKTDSQGSLEAVSNLLDKNEDVEIILKAIGDINKSDIFLAKSTKSIVIGFSVNVADEITQLAKQEKVIIKTYNIIYNLFDELKEVSNLLKEKKMQEKTLKGEAKIIANFMIEGEKIFGVKLTKGKITLGDNLEMYRGQNLIGKTKLVSLKIRAKTVSEVKKDQEAGMIFGPILDIRQGDVVKSIP